MKSSGLTTIPFAASTCEILPPTSSLLSALRIGDSDPFVGRREQEAIAGIAEFS